MDELTVRRAYEAAVATGDYRRACGAIRKIITWDMIYALAWIQGFTSNLSFSKASRKRTLLHTWMHTAIMDDISADERVCMGTIELNLAEVMKEKNVTLEELAAFSGIGDECANKIEEDAVSAIRFSTLGALCDGLGCEPGDIYTVQA